MDFYKQSGWILSLVGPRRSGKSVRLKKLLKTELKGRFLAKNVFIICPTLDLNDDYKDFSNVKKFSNVDKGLIEKIIDQQTKNIKMYGIEKTPEVLLILDDCADSNILSFKGVLDTLAIRGRHMKINVIITSQRLSAISRTIRLNTDIWYLYSPYNFSELEQFLHEFIPSQYKKSAIRRVLEYFSEPYRYIIIDNQEKDVMKKIKNDKGRPFDLT